MARILLKVVVLSVALFCVNGQLPFPTSGGGTGSGAALENMMRRLAMSGGGAGSSGSGEAGGLSGLSALGATGGIPGLGTPGGLGAGSAGIYGSIAGRGAGRRGRGGRGQMMRNLMLIQQFGLDNFMEYSMCNRFMPPGRLSSMVCLRYLY